MWGMSYIPLEEPSYVKPPCEHLGHFYEDYECIYCPARYCATEKDGHSFEGQEPFLPVGEIASPRYCYHCKQQRVNFNKR